MIKIKMSKIVFLFALRAKAQTKLNVVVTTSIAT